MKADRIWEITKTTLADRRLHIIMVGLLITVLLEEKLSWVRNSHYFFYEALTIIVCSGSGIFDTYQSVRVRILATCFGLVFGIAMAFIQPMNAWIAIFTYILIYYLAERFNWQEFIGISGSVFLVLYFYHNELNNENVLVYAYWRVFHTLVGAVIVLALSYPYLRNDVSGNEELCEQVSAVADELFILTRSVVLGYNKSYAIDLERLLQDIKQIEKRRNMLIVEQKYKKQSDARLHYLADIIEAIDDMRISLYYLMLNNYNVEHLDEDSCELVNQEYAANFFRQESYVTIYTNNLAVRKLMHCKNIIERELLVLLNADRNAEVRDV